ncbi:MAG: ABC transporter permease [Christensenellales bacterium]
MDLGERSLNGAALSLNKQYQEGETLVHTQKKTYTVVGIMERMGSESYSSACYTALSFLQPATLSPGASITAYMQLAHPSKTHEIIPSIAEQIGITDGNINYNRFLLAYYGSFDDYNLSNMFSGLGVILIALIMVGSVSVIYNAFAISAMERKKQFGLLASIGATQKQIRKSIWQEGLTVGLIGIPSVSSPVFWALPSRCPLYSLSSRHADPHNATLSLYVSPPLILLSVLIAGVTIALSVFIPARRAAKTPPVEAIRATQEIKANGKVRTNRLTQRIFGFEANLAKKQMQRNRKRYRTTIFSLFMSLVMFLSFSSFVHYMKTGLDMQFQGGDYDYSINGPTNQDNQTPHLDEVYNQLKSNPYVSQCAERSSLSLSMKLDDSLFSSSFLSELRTQGVGLIEKTEELDFEQLPLSVYALSDEEYDTLLSQHHLSSPDRSGLILVDQFQYKSEDGVKHLLSGVNKSALPKEITLVDFEEIENTREEEFDVVPYETKPVFVSAQLIGTVSELPYAVFPPSTSLVFLCSKTQYQTLHKAFPSDESMGRTLFVSVANEQYEAFDAWRQQNPLLNDHSSLYVYSVHEVIEANRRVLIVLSIFCYGFITLMTLISITSVLNTISTTMQLRKRNLPCCSP